MANFKYFPDLQNGVDDADVEQVVQAFNEIEDDITALQNRQETDPTVPSWAKEPQKPTYTADEVGALPSNTKIPTKISDLENDLTELQDVIDDVGDLNNLATEDKSNLVNAVNELDAYLAEKVNGAYVDAVQSQLESDLADEKRERIDADNQFISVVQTLSETINEESSLRQEADAELRAAIQNTSKTYVVTELPTENIDRSGLYILVPEGPVMGVGGMVSDCPQLYVYDDELEVLIPVGVTPGEINDALDFYYKPDGSGGSVDLSNYYTKEETDAALESSLEWKLIGEAQITQEAIDEAGEDGITAITIDLGKKMTVNDKWYGETMIEIKIPQCDDLNSFNMGRLRVFFGGTEEQATTGSGGLCVVAAPTNNALFTPAWKQHHIITSNWTDRQNLTHSLISYRAYNAAQGYTVTPYITVNSGSTISIVGRRFLGVAAIEGVSNAKLPVDTTVKLYGRF